MIEITGKYNNAVCYCSEIDDAARIQLQEICSTKSFSDSKIRIMPDVHAGKGCTIGTTMTINSQASPNLVGVDIGCGMLAVNLGKIEIDFAKFDEAAHYVPSGFSVWDKRKKDFELEKLYCYEALANPSRIKKSLGTLGGGNHFIELDKADDGNIYLVIHTGSRNLGRQVAGIYQHIASSTNGYEKSEYLRKRQEIIDEYKSMGRQTEIEQALKDFAFESENINPELSCVEGRYFDDYIHDLKICQEFARINREVIAEALLSFTGILNHTINEFHLFHTTHNYIDTDEMILRKGAVAAHSGERLLIPLNMRDGALICIGKGNPDWNYSAPHGAGRILSRTQAQNNLTVEAFIESMQGIYTTSVNESTLDESPMAYKNPQDILNFIGDTVEITDRVKPIYNFKAGK